MKAWVYDSYTSIFPNDDEVRELCRPGAGAETCVWLMFSRRWECCYYDRRGINLIGESLEERWRKGLTVAKRDGCDKVKEFNPAGKSGLVII